MDEQPGVENPFAPSQCDASSSTQTRVRLVDWIACLVMFPWFASNYMCWAISYLKLGRAPVPGVDLVQETDSTIMRVSCFISDFFHRIWVVCCLFPHAVAVVDSGDSLFESHETLCFSIRDDAPFYHFRIN